MTCSRCGKPKKLVRKDGTEWTWKTRTGFWSGLIVLLHSWATCCTCSDR